MFSKLLVITKQLSDDKHVKNAHVIAVSSCMKMWSGAVKRITVYTSKIAYFYIDIDRKYLRHFSRKLRDLTLGIEKVHVSKRDGFIHNVGNGKWPGNLRGWKIVQKYSWDTH